MVVTDLRRLVFLNVSRAGTARGKAAVFLHNASLVERTLSWKVGEAISNAKIHARLKNPFLTCSKIRHRRRGSDFYFEDISFVTTFAHDIFRFITENPARKVY